MIVTSSAVTGRRDGESGSRNRSRQTVSEGGNGEGNGRSRSGRVRVDETSTEPLPATNGLLDALPGSKELHVGPSSEGIRNLPHLSL